MKQKYEIRSHFRTKFHSRILFYFIFLFFSLFFLRLSFPPIRLRVLYPVLVNIRGRKRKKFKKVFSGNCWEESYPQLEGKFHPSYLNFFPAFVALEREKFLGQFSPNVQIPSNFPRIAFRDNFAFQTFSRIFNPPSKKRNAILFLFLRYSISHCQRIRLFPSFFHSRQISSFNHLDVLPYNFQMLFRATWRAPFDKERVAKTRFNAT